MNNIEGKSMADVIITKKEVQEDKDKIKNGSTFAVVLTDEYLNELKYQNIDSIRLPYTSHIKDKNTCRIRIGKLN